MNHSENIGNIYSEYVDDMYSYSMFLGYSEQVAQDAIHDVYCKIFANPQLLDGIRNVRAFLIHSLKNRLLDISKKKREVLGLPNDSLLSEGSSAVVQVTIEDEYIQNEDRVRISQKVASVLSVLTDRQREIIYLRYMQELEYEEISTILSLSIPSCRKAVHMAIAKLKKNNSYTLFIFLLTTFR